MSELEQKDQENNNIAIPIDWDIPENFPTPYASNVFVQSGEYEIIISFFQTQLPLLTGTPEETKTKLEQIKAIKAECVGRVIVNPELVPKIIDALQSGLNNYNNQKRLLEGRQPNEQ